MTLPFGTVVPSSLKGRIDTALHIVPAGALEVACMGTGCLLHPQELNEWQLLPSLLMKFLFSLAGGGRGTSTFSHPRFSSVCVPEVARPDGLAHGFSPSLGPSALIWSRVSGVAGWKHRAALEWGAGGPAVILGICPDVHELPEPSEEGCLMSSAPDPALPCARSPAFHVS